MFIRTLAFVLSFALIEAYSKNAEQPVKMRKMEVPVKIPSFDAEHPLIQKIPSKKPVHSIQIAKNQTTGKFMSEPTGYIQFFYYYNDHCEEPVFATSGVGTGTCFVALDDSGATLGSVTFSVESHTDDTQTIAYTYYMDDSCTTAIASDSVSILMTCASYGTTSTRTSFTDDLQPWTKAQDGLVTQLYGTEEQCSTNEAYGLWNVVSKDVCISDGVQGSSRMTLCENGVYNWAGYFDLDCEELAGEVSTPLATCEHVQPSEDDDSAATISSYSSQSCTGDSVKKAKKNPYTSAQNPYRMPLGSTCTGPHEFCCEAPGGDPNNCPSSARTSDCDAQGACCCA